MKNENVDVLDPRDQRKLAVAKLKLAASFPRLKGGRRPQMVQPESVGDGEKVQDNRDQTPDTDTPSPESIEPQVEVDAQIQEPSTEETEVTAVRPPHNHSDSSPKHDTTVPTHLFRSSIPNHRLSSPPPPSPSLIPPPPLPPLPPLDQRNRLQLRRSYSTIRRQTAIHTFTGDVYDLPLSPAATPPPLRVRPRCNLTVTGDERLLIEHPLKHKQRLNILTPRVPKEVDAEANSGKDRSAATTNSLRTPPMPLLLTPPPTPSPQIQHHPDILPNIRARFRAPKHFPSTSAIPKRMKSSPLLTLNKKSTEQDRPAPARWRGVVVEEEDDERSEMLFQYSDLPPNIPERAPINGSSSRDPRSSDVPLNISTEPARTGTVNVPVYLSHRTPSKRHTLPTSSYLTPRQDRVQGKDAEEEILYPSGPYRLRSPYDTGYGPEIRLPIDDDDIDREKDNEFSIDRAPSSTSVSYLRQDAYDSFPCAPSNSRHNVVVESKIPSDTTSFQTPPSLPPVAVLSTSLARTSDEPVSSWSLPFQLSAVASPAQGDPIPLSTDFMDLDGRTLGIDTSKRSGGDTTSTSTWERIVSSRSSSHSRTNSFGPREALDRTDSSISREWDGSTLVTRQSEIMQSSSASASVSALTRPSVSPGPLTSGVDYLQYQSSKLFPYPGMRKLEEECRLRGRIGGSLPTPDVSILGSGVEGEQVPTSAKSFNTLPAVELGVEHRIGHQTSDATMRYQYLNSSATVPLSSQQDDFSISSAGSSLSKLPTVRKWLKAKKSKFLSSSSPPGDGASNTASLSRPTQDNETVPEHEEPPINGTGTLFDMGYAETIPVSLTDVSKDEMHF
ncbi:hypothetical protein ARMSODRAFT_530229 [Armillaria solidipes]|uniref:Uncharacterized protein n=1 Tax=Armillaria solidipes TaxID=1076256 RepID=A0A2H3BC76_9AGAR|nr:hypothetical protein ARMSODRAFT_530229 [Armillaria solidipes]